MEKETNKSQKKNKGLWNKIATWFLAATLAWVPLSLSAKQKIETTHKEDIKKTIQVDNKDCADNYNAVSPADRTNESNIPLNAKVPPKLKKLYKKLLKYNSKKDFQDLVLTGEELWYFINLVPQHSNSKLGNKFVDHIQKIFNANWNISIRMDDFGWLKLATVLVWGIEVFCINHTIQSPTYGCWKVWDTPIIVENSSSGYKVLDVNREQIRWWYVVLYNGNLVEVDENGDYEWRAFLYWDTWFKEDFWKAMIAATKSPSAMIKDKYEKKKLKISDMLPDTKSLQDQWYKLEWDDRLMTVNLEKNNINSGNSEPILDYKSDKAFLKRLKEAQDKVDGGLEIEKEKEGMFDDFYADYFEDNGIYKNNDRYELRREWSTKFYLIDRYNQKKKIENKATSIFDGRWKLIDDSDLNGMINKYEAQGVYLKFIANNNTKNTLNKDWRHMDNSYYLWYPIVYKDYDIKLDCSPFTDWRYAVVVSDSSWNHVWKFFLDNFMSSSDVEKEIEKIIK